MLNIMMFAQHINRVIGDVSTVSDNANSSSGYVFLDFPEIVCNILKKVRMSLNIQTNNFLIYYKNYNLYDIFAQNA